MHTRYSQTKWRSMAVYRLSYIYVYIYIYENYTYIYTHSAARYILLYTTFFPVQFLAILDLCMWMEVDTSDNMMANIPPWKLTWQWKINMLYPFFNGRYIFKWLLFAIVMTWLQHHLDLRWCTAFGWWLFGWCLLIPSVTCVSWIQFCLERGDRVKIIG